jgi:hypothetical protein
MTSDLPAALGFLAAVAAIALVLERISFTRVLLGAVVIAGLFLAKMSAALLLPMAALLALARIADGRPLPLGTRRMIARRPQQVAALAVVALAQTVVVVVLVWAAYGFRYSAFSATAPAPRIFHDPWEWELELPPPREMLAQLDLDSGQRRQIEPLLRPGSGDDATWTLRSRAAVDEIRAGVLNPAQAARLEGLLHATPTRGVAAAIHFCRELRLLPEAFLYGYAHAWRSSGERAGFLNGEVRNTGWWYFFPYVFAVKTPLAFLAGVSLALVGMIVRIRRDATTATNMRARVAWNSLQPLFPLLVLLIVYWIFAIASNLNIGHRHLLPIYPALCILAAGMITWFQPAESAESPLTWPRIVALGVLVVVVVEAASWFPNYLAYFNGLVRPRTAYQHVIDSSLDWGQELPAIARYLQAHPREPSYLAYFGVGSPAAYGINAHLIGGHPNFDGKYSPPMKVLRGKTPAELAAFYREHPDYDPDFIMRLDGAAEPAALATQRSSQLRLGPGLYVISASMAQPIYNGNVDGYWTAASEATYQRLKREVQPFYADDREAKIAAMPAHTIAEWKGLFDDYYDFRLSRLNTFLLRRPPDDLINYSVLVYRLTAADLAQALDGPPLEERARSY